MHSNRRIVFLPWYAKESTGPILGVPTLAKFMFTPGGLRQLADFSARALRRQTNVMSDVGEELVGEGWRALKQPLRVLARREDQPDKGKRNSG